LHTGWPASSYEETAMKWFYDLKIATKLIVSFGAVLLLTLVLGISNIFS
jgi:methyl-accepting chemotaxis protein